MSWAEPIRRALDIVPLVPDCRWFLRDPVFAGLHTLLDYGDGRNSENTTHVCYPSRLSGPADRRLTTVVIPERPYNNQYDIDGLVHELGHVVHWMTDFDRTCTPIGEYAETHLHESFAEAFTGWLIPDYVDRWNDDYRSVQSPRRSRHVDPDDVAWFEASLMV